MVFRCQTCGSSGEVSSRAAFCPACGAPLGVRGDEVPAVELVGVGRSFGTRRVLHNLCLEVPAGESLVIVGLSGSGKSVLLDHILGFQRPDSGEVRIHGVPVPNLSAASKSGASRAQIGMVFQGAALLDSLTVRENILLASTASGCGATNPATEADRYLQAVGLSSSDGELFPGELSGGMQKRVGIARALMANPEIVLYDEPTTGLDAATSASISRLMRQLQQARPGSTSITITHDYLSAGLIADRVLFLNHATGNLEEILGREDLRSLRAVHGGETAAAIQAIRQRLESFFERVPLVVRSGRAVARDKGWVSALINVTTFAIRDLGAAALLLPRIGGLYRIRQLWQQLRDIGYQSLLMSCLTGLFLGLILTLQISLALRTVGYDMLPGLVSMILLDRVGPLFVGLLMAGRVGASVSADTGGKRLSRQFDALRVLGITPERFWLAPAFWATVVSVPVLAVCLEASALAGSYAVCVARGYVNSAAFLDHMFDRVSWGATLFGLSRTALFGMVIVLVAYTNGSSPKRDSEDVGRATTRAVVSGLIGVIAMDFLATFIASLVLE